MTIARSNTSCGPSIYGYGVDEATPAQGCSASAAIGTCPDTNGDSGDGDTDHVCIREVELTGGINNDESDTLIELFNEFLEAGEPVKCFICARQNPIYINKTVTLYASNVDITFVSPVVYGATGALRMFGEQPEITRNGKLKAKLRATAIEGSMLLELSTNPENMQASEFILGDVIILRGQNDMFGKALTKQTVHVAAIDAGLNNLTIAEELENDFEPTYPDSSWPPDLTTGTTVALTAYAAMSVVGAVDDVLVGVDQTQLIDSGISVGSVVLVSTAEVESDINVHAHTGGGTPYRNAARLEIKKITAIDTQAVATVTFDSPLIDTYGAGAPKFAGVTLLTPIENSIFRGIKASYNAAQTSRNTHGIQIGYGYKCRIEDCEVDGSGGGKGNGIRISNSLECEALNCRVLNPMFTGSGEGYGFTAYYGDRNRFVRCYGDGCRHTYLMQKANHTMILLCQSVNDWISGFDCHGVRSFNTHFSGCRGIGGPGLSSDATHKSIFRVGNTSHACGDFGTMIEGCYIEGAVISGLIDTYAALEMFGASEDISMRGCYVTDCDTGIRGGYDNLAGAGEDDDILNAIVRNNNWIRVDNPIDLKSTSVVELDNGGLTKVVGTLADDQTFSNVITTSAAPNIASGDPLISTVYTAKAPNRSVRVDCILPYISTGTATCAAMTIWADGVCIGTGITRLSTTGANSGTQMIATGAFVGTGLPQTILVQFGPNTAATLTVNSRFAHSDTQQPCLILTEMD